MTTGNPNYEPPLAVHPSMELEDVFLHFLPKFEALPSGPKSVAEAKISFDELESLTNWLCERWEFGMWCQHTWQVESVSSSQQEMCGSLLLIFASEVCRDRCNEDAVWPAITGILRRNKGSFPTLFAGGQPTSVCKDAIVAGTRRLNLRNLIDRYGTQEYFDTLKLQFGFTLKGAIRRMPDWLDGIGVPIAVKILCGTEPEYVDLRSGSFVELWSALYEFRRGRSPQDYTAAVVQRSPWVRQDWSERFLNAAKLRTARSYSASAPVEAAELSGDAVCQPVLRWEYPAAPRVFLRLNEQRIREILEDIDTAVFAVDGRIVDRWTVQEGGEWRGRSELPCQPDNVKPNLRPKLLSISGDGRVLEELDLVEIGASDAFVIFDLGSGASIDPSERIDPRKNYAIICDSDISVPGATKSLRLKDRSAYWLASPWRQDVLAVSDGAPYWQPNIDERAPLTPIHLTIESLPDKMTEIGSPSRVLARGIPSTAETVALIIGNSAHQMIQLGGDWQTEHAVMINPGMVLGHEPIRVRLSGSGYTRRVTPKLSLNLRGVVCRDTGAGENAVANWTLVSRHLPLNRADGSGCVRIFAGTMKSHLYEGAHLITRITRQPVPLRDLFGWGSQLIAVSADLSESTLVGSVEDCGLGRILPPLLGRPTGACYWRTPVSPSSGHQVLVWPNLLQTPLFMAINEVITHEDDLVWKFPSLGARTVIAIAYKGVRIASYWTSDPIIRALRFAPTRNLFSLLRWLKLPVLNVSFKAAMQEAINRAAPEFVKGWLGDHHLLDGLLHRAGEQGLDTVVRAFLWNHNEVNESRMKRLAASFPPGQAECVPRSESDEFKSSVCRLAERCPSVAYNLARMRFRGENYRKDVSDIVARLMDQTEASDLPRLKYQLMAACRDCAKLVGSTPEELNEGVNEYRARLDSKVSNNNQFEVQLRRLAETSRGPKFIAAALLFGMLEASEP